MRPASELLPDDYLQAAERRGRQFSGTFDQGTSGTLAADCLRLLKERKLLMGTISDLEHQNAALREAVENRIAFAEAACCEGQPLCRSIDTRGPLVDPETVIAEDDEAIGGRCVSGFSQAEAEKAWEAVRERHQEMHAAIRQEPAEPVRPQRVFGVAGARLPSADKGIELLRQAIDTIEQRSAVYGPPAKHFKITVGLLNAAFAERLQERIEDGREPFELADWPLIMILDKVARTMGPVVNPDTDVDLAGYAATRAACAG